MAQAFPKLQHPIVQAPLAGGPSTPALAAAVSGAGGLGFLAAGYLTPDALRADIARAREGTEAPFGVNLFCLSEAPVAAERVAAYAQRLAPEARRHGVALGTPRFEDDAFAAKLDLVLAEGVPIVSFTFGCPSATVVAGLHDAQIAVWVTVTDPDEALTAARAGADALVLQGVEAGGHRGSFTDTDGTGELGLLPLIRLVARDSALPLVAAGGIGDGAGVAAVLAAGAAAAQIGTGFLLCPEAGTSAPQRAALAVPGRTTLTRAFTGRRARGVVNRFLSEHGPHAPSAYPHVHHLTAPLRQAARASGDAAAINLWAGETYPLTEEAPAAELVRRWSADAAAALAAATERLTARDGAAG
jgi:nitronate monooxygenase